MALKHSAEDILELLQSGPKDKRQIAKTLKIKGQGKTKLRQMLRQMVDDEKLIVGDKRTYALPGTLPEVTLAVITHLEDGDLIARPADAHVDYHILIPSTDKLAGRAAVGSRLLVRTKMVMEGQFEGQIIKVFEAKAADRVVGIYISTAKGGQITPTNRRNKKTYLVAAADAKEAKQGDLVIGEITSGEHSQTPNATIIEALGPANEAHAISMIAIADQEIPYTFPPAVTALAEQFTEPPQLGDREDLRKIPLTTIDGADARDFDDAVFAEPDNKGWHLIVAIADVAHYVREGNALDNEAVKRGNSVYFPDRVVPMLPEHLSNGLCSLNPEEDRACMAVHIWIDKNGVKTRHKFVRGLMRSHGRHTYEEVENNKKNFKDLYDAFGALRKARVERGALDLHLPERKIIFNEAGHIAEIIPAAILPSHNLIEEFMVLANVCAAETLQEKDFPCVYRIHDLPSKEKMHDLGIFLKDLPYSLATKSVPTPKAFMGILNQAKGSKEEMLINTLVLRSQSQAKYDTNNIGHFGLGLRNYAHFTSPIRRYADLLVHRALIQSLKLGDDGFAENNKIKLAKDVQETAEHISFTERRAVAAERESKDRYVAQYLSNKVGARFPGTVNGVTRHGLFITLEETGADGFVPARLLNDFYTFDEKRHTLTGRRNRHTFTLGDKATVILKEADPFTGSLIFTVDEPGSKPGKFTRGKRHNFDRKKHRTGKPGGPDHSGNPDRLDGKGKKPHRKGKRPPQDGTTSKAPSSRGNFSVEKSATEKPSSGKARHFRGKPSSGKPSSYRGKSSSHRGKSGGARPKK